MPPVAATAADDDEEVAAQAPTIRKLGPIFKLTEVHLWDGFDVARRRNSSEDEQAIPSAATNVKSLVKQEMEEDLELAQLMDAMGLPVSFSTTKEKNVTNRGKKKGTQATPGAANSPINDAVATCSNVDELKNVGASIVCDDLTRVLSLCRVGLDYAEASPGEVNKVIEESRGSVCSAGGATDVVAEDDCETGSSHFCDKMIDLAKPNFPVEENQASDVASQLNKESLEHHFLGNESTISFHEVGQEGRLSKMEDEEKNMDISSVLHDTTDDNSELIDISTSESCKSSVESSVVDHHVQTSDCSLHYEHGDWRVVWDTFYERYYFYNVHTQESTWYPPPGLEDFALPCSTYASKGEDVQISQDISNLPQVNHNNCMNFDQSSISSCADNVTDDSMLGADQLIESNVVQHLVTCINQKETSDEVDISKDLGRQPKDILGNQAQHSPRDDLINEGLLPLTVNGAHYNGNVQNKSSDTNVIDMAWGVATAKKKRRVRRSQSRKKILCTYSYGEHTFQDVVGSMSSDIIKYWSQRYLLFSRFDSGIKMDEEGWFSVTPELISKHHASRCGSGIVIDCFTGVGGNAIQFAMKCNHVIAIDIDPQKIDYAQHNAAIYGLTDQIDFVVSDFIQMAPRLKGETVFMSPPWGGPDYAKVEIYDIRTMLKPCDGYSLFKLATVIAPRVVMFLPRNVDLNQLVDLALSVDPPWTVEVEKNFLNGKLKAITAYFEAQGCAGTRNQ